MINLLLGFGLSALWLPWAPRSGHELRWGLLIVALGAILLYQRREAKPVTWPMVFGLAFTIYAWTSVFWSPNPYLAIGRASEIGTLFIAFHIAATAHTYERLQLYRGLILGLVPSAILIPFQMAGYAGVEQWAAPAGTFVNKLFVAELALPLAIIALARGWWAYAIPPVAALLLTASRGAWIAAAMTAGIYWARHSIWKLCAVWAAFPLLAYGAALCSPATANHRLEIWSYGLDNLVWLGHGIGSFMGVHGAEHLHNDYLEVAYELGLPGSVLLILSLATLQRHGAEYYAGCAIFITACFSFPLHNPATAFLAAYLAGCLSRGALPVCGGAAVWGSLVGARMARPARRYGLGHLASRQG